MNIFKSDDWEFKKVIVELKIPIRYGCKTDNEYIEFVHKILLGGEGYPLIDPCKPYCGGMVKIKCGKTNEICSVHNDININDKSNE